jgi:hypothetical protein
MKLNVRIFGIPLGVQWRHVCQQFLHGGRGTVSVVGLTRRLREQ